MDWYDTSELDWSESRKSNMSDRVALQLVTQEIMQPRRRWRSRIQVHATQIHDALTLADDQASCIYAYH